MSFVRIEGREGLARAVADLSSLDASRDVFVFDFDRTLTNGFASPEQTLSIEQRIRGGNSTLAVLNKLKSLNIPLYIVTARNPSRLTIEQLEASITNCQHELEAFFLPQKEDSYVVSKLENGMNMAYRGSLYASDYSKPNAIRHILSSRSSSTTTRLHFVDDFVGNAFDVGSMMMNDAAMVVEVVSYWWDSFAEESAGEMGLVSSFSSDFVYQPGTLEARARFGLSAEESARRLAWVLAYERQHNITKPASLVEDKPVVKKKDMSAFQGLLAFGAPRPPPPPPSS